MLYILYYIIFFDLLIIFVINKERRWSGFNHAESSIFVINNIIPNMNRATNSRTYIIIDQK